MKTYVTGPMRLAVDKHVLEEMSLITGPHPVQMYCLRAFNKARTTFVFSHAGVVISGGLAPYVAGSPAHGVMSGPGYGLAWFLNIEEEDELCEHFLKKAYYPAHGRIFLERQIVVLEERRRVLAPLSLSVERANELIEIDDTLLTLKEHLAWTDELSHADFLALLRDVLNEEEKDQGHGFDPLAAGWLCALHQRFTASYKRNYSGISKQA